MWEIVRIRSVKPWSRSEQISRSRTGTPSIGISGFGMSGNRSEIRVPRPPAMMIVFIIASYLVFFIAAVHIHSAQVSPRVRPWNLPLVLHLSAPVVRDGPDQVLLVLRDRAHLVVEQPAVRRA